MLQRASVNVHIKPVPFEAGRDHLVRPGGSVAAIVGGISKNLLRLPADSVVCRLNGDPVLRSEWDFIFPEGGAGSVRLGPAHGGTSGTRPATVGIMIASAYTGGLAAAAWGAWAGAAVATGTAITGYVAKNALIPQQQGDLSMRSGSAEDMSRAPVHFRDVQHGPAIRADSPRVRQGAAVSRPGRPVVHRGRAQRRHIRAAACWIGGIPTTEAPLEALDFKIGETDLAEFDSVQMEHSSLIVDGVHYPEQDLSLYPSAVNEIEIGVEVEGYDPDTGEGGDWDVRTGTMDTDESVLVVKYPQGTVFGRRVDDRVHRAIRGAMGTDRN